MFLNNQTQKNFLASGKFTPTSRTTTSHGTTVTYNLSSDTGVNAYNTNNQNSGMYQPNQPQYNQTNSQQYPQWQNHLENQWPTHQFTQAFSQPYTQQPYHNQLQNQQHNQQLVSQYNNYNPMTNQQQFAHPQHAYVPGAIVQPNIDISETSSDVIVVAHVGNVSVTDINLSTSENSVTITASGWVENQNISLNRTVALPTSIKAEAVDACLQSGLLEIKCPKVERAHRNRVIVKADHYENTPNTTVE